MSEIKQVEFVKAFRNYFFNEDAVKRIQQVAKSNFNVNIVVGQAKKLLDEFWADKKVRNKKHFNEITDDDLAKWIVVFVNEHKGQ